MLNVENVIDESSDISIEMLVLNVLISLESSLDVYDDKSIILLEANDFTKLASLDV